MSISAQCRAYCSECSRVSCYNIYSYRPFIWRQRRPGHIRGDRKNDRLCGKLYDCLSESDYEGCMRCIAEGTFDSETVFNHNPLNIINGNLEIAKTLLAVAPWLLDQEDHIGATPIRYAVRYHRFDFFMFLLDRGAYPDPLVLSVWNPSRDPHINLAFYKILFNTEIARVNDPIKKLFRYSDSMDGYTDLQYPGLDKKLEKIKSGDYVEYEYRLLDMEFASAARQNFRDGPTPESLVPTIYLMNIGGEFCEFSDENFHLSLSGRGRRSLLDFLSAKRKLLRLFNRTVEGARESCLILAGCHKNNEKDCPFARLEAGCVMMIVKLVLEPIQ